ncbi:MAG: hypothetical protein GF317_18050 [Candidatus Lokiarchaeota archaeon]|nr:hypothetical protein [Candidatus Lokiarchaeota archaeon]MBD3201416.1 hypothetical protein [Candidatus Lokiarchaeota archaeon]
MGEEKKCLVFIFNADSGAISSVKDFFHKMVKPSTYECNLCAVTFGNFGMKKDWAQYISSLEDEVNIEFLHRDEFEEYYPSVTNAEYPSAYIEKPDGLELFISQEEMNNVESVKELKKLVSKRLKKYL